MGIFVGASLTLPTTIERYSLGDPALDESSFGMLPGITGGTEINLILGKKLELSIGLQYSLTRFSYSATPLPYTSYSYTENQHQVLLPLSLLFKFPSNDRKMSYYLRAGAAPSYLIHATGDGNRSSEAVQDDIAVESQELLDSRMAFNLDAFLGWGFRVSFDNSFFFGELRLSSRVLQANIESERYQNNDLNWTLYHVDSDFRIYQGTFCVGMCWNLSKK